VRLAALELVNFRSWTGLGVEFPAGSTALVGPNATGKTSILEAIWYVASLGSHRASADGVLVRAGETQAIVRGSVDHAGRGEVVELEIVTQGRARARLSGAAVTRRRDVLGTLRASIFAPERVAVIRGDPGERRSFANELLIQLHPRYHAVIRDYDKALRQRNALLREADGRAPAGLEAWDEALAGPGGELCAGRDEAVAALAPSATAAYEAVGDGSRLTVAYAPNVARPEDGTAAAWTRAIRLRLEERQRDEIVRGVTLAGPHRDDLDVAIDGLPSRTHASQGEAWLAALALVLGAHGAIAARIGEEPVLLLDDAFSVLDPARRRRLASALPPGAQIIATASDPNEIPSTASWVMHRVSVNGVTPDA